MVDLMTQQQRDLARHALGLTNGRKYSYRNHFTAHVGTPNGRAWLDLVERGLATGGTFRFDGLRGFALTRAGAEAALDPGETLDPEDFPNG